MKRVDLATGILCIWGLGTMIPSSGCWSGHDEALGQFCASPAEGGTYCVDTALGTDAAWNDAMANGSDPIQMWAVWPKKYELREVVFVQNEFFASSQKQEMPINVQIWADKEALSQMQMMVDQAKVDGAPFAAQYKTLVDDFLAYRATEAAETLL